ncbi:MAG: MEDS domain-containing protein [Methylosarcina sp.]
MPNKKLLTINEASELLKVSKASLRRWTNSGRLRCYRVGERHERRFDLDDLTNLIGGASDQGAAPGHSPLLTAGSGQSNDPAQQQAVDIARRRHICTFYKSPKEQWQLIRDHFLMHTQAKARTIYLYHGDRDRVVNWIKSEGLDAEQLIRQGTLLLLSTAESYYLNGFFNIDQMLEFWKERFSEARNPGIESLLLTGEMGWANGNIIGHEQLVPYEAALDNMLELYPWVTAVCQYPVYQISGVTVFDNLSFHTHVQLTQGLAPCFNQSANAA